MTGAVAVQKVTNTGAVKTSGPWTGTEACVWLIQAERKRKAVSDGKQVSQCQRWEYLRLMLSEWAVQTDWQGTRIGKGNWRSRWGKTVLPRICLVSEGEIFELYPPEWGCWRCNDEIAVYKTDGNKGDLDPEDQGRDSCNHWIKQIFIYWIRWIENQESNETWGGIWGCYPRRRVSHFRQIVFVVSVNNRVEMPWGGLELLALWGADKAGDKELRAVCINAVAEVLCLWMSSAQGQAAAWSAGLGFQKKKIIHWSHSFLKYQSFEFADSA